MHRLARTMVFRTAVMMAVLLAAQGLPRGATAATEGIGQAAWPVDSKDLIFIWENASLRNEVGDPADKDFRSCFVAAQGEARFNRFWDMDVGRGSYRVELVTEELREACRKTGQISFEALITPMNPGPVEVATIVSLALDRSSRDFTLNQEKDKLVLRLRTSQGGAEESRTELCDLAAGQARHIVVSYRDGQLACTLDGKPVHASTDVQGDLRPWNAKHLLFGDAVGGGCDWAGRIEGIAIYNRFLSPEQAAQEFKAYAERFKSRKPISRWVVEARLVEPATIPDPKQVDYRQAMVEYTYKVEKVISGKLADMLLHVAHWGFMDRVLVPRTTERKKGGAYRLTLELFNDHPELQGEMYLLGRGRKISTRRCTTRCGTEPAPRRSGCRHGDRKNPPCCDVMRWSKPS